MVTDGGISVVAGISSALNFGYRSVQTGYQFQGVPEQTRELLATIETSKKNIQYARSLRTQKSKTLNERQKTHIDDKITDTEAALDGLEVLVEAARVDMMTNFGRIGARNRTLWIVRDSAQVGTSLARINVAMIALNAMITMMDLRDGDKNADEQQFHFRAGGVPPTPPPTYKTSEYLHQSRILRSSISCESTTITSDSEARGDDQNAENTPADLALSRPLNPFMGDYELDGSHQHLPIPFQQTVTRYIPECLRAGPTASQLFGSIENTRRFQSRAAWLDEHARDISTYPSHSRPPVPSHPRQTDQATSNNHRMMPWGGMNEVPGDQPVRRQSWLAHRASLLN